MPDQFTAATLRQHIAAAKLSWSANPDLADTAPIALHPLGGDTKNLPLATAVPAVNLQKILLPSPNDFITELRIERGLAPPNTVLQRKPVLGPITAQTAVRLTPAQAAAPAAGASPASSAVDWRNRWGWPWITTVQDQGACEACWAFCTTAVVESMARIEHFVWSKRSEGDVHDGMGSKCADGGSPSAAMDWITKNGICDPACYPWSGANPPYKPTSDRSGRTVEIPAHVELGNINDQKNWIDTVGPIGVTFSVYHDFDGYSSGVYTKGPTTAANYFRGTHCVCIVGYDDSKQAWLIKNSWGTGWGMSGYCWIGYGQADIDTWSKQGVQGTNTDPWTKRRTHSGAMIESGDGTSHDNFELLAADPSGTVTHYWRDGAALTWHNAGLIGATGAAACPTLTGTTYTRNFECIYLTTSRRLHHYFFDQGSQKWVDGGIFGPTDATGVPGFIQSNYGAPGNFEVVVRTSDGRLNHWWRTNGAPWTWSDGGRFGANIALSGASLVQTQYGNQGNLELVAVLATGQMQHWWRNDDSGNVWAASATFGSGVTSPPCMIEGQYGASDENHPGNFELCVAVGGQIQHWWRDNQGNQQWQMSATFGSGLGGNVTIRSVVALVEGSYGFNLEVVALRSDNQLQHFWRDGAGWHNGPVIGPA
jgi:C1A family cysteine protease